MITTHREDELLHIQIDDGKLNVITLEIAEALQRALSDAADDPQVHCVLLQGNERALTVGLDTTTVLKNDEASRALLDSMGKVLKTLYLSRLKSVVISQGHATAAGAMLLLVADQRIGCGEGGKVGLSEVRAGLPVPQATQQLVKDRISARYQYECTALARLFDYQTAETAGFFDSRRDTLPEALEVARQAVDDLAALNEEAYLKTKLGMREAYSRIVS